MTGQRTRWTPDVLALSAFGVIAAAATVIAVVESYSNLLAFALTYGLTGWRAGIAPGCVDSFIIMGELLLFVTLIRHWDRVPYATGLAMAGWGFLISAAGNIWHAPHAAIADKAVSVIWPLTAAAGMAGGLMIIERVTAKTPVPGDDSKPRAARAVAPGLGPAPVPPLTNPDTPAAEPDHVPVPPSFPRRNPVSSSVRAGGQGQDNRTAILHLRELNPGWTHKKIAAAAGTSAKTVSRHLAHINGSTS